ncbi:hypothetical protein V6N13_141061 [Hibiscus sabdariffa]
MIDALPSIEFLDPSELTLRQPEGKAESSGHPGSRCNRLTGRDDTRFTVRLARHMNGRGEVLEELRRMYDKLLTNTAVCRELGGWLAVAVAATNTNV